MWRSQVRAFTEHRPNAGCSKWHPSKAAGSSATEAYPWGTLQGDGRLRTTLGVIFSILLVRKLRRLDCEWRPREGFEKCEQVRFFFLCQTKWLHEGTQIWIGPTAFV
jgi:hypothetical protein